MNNCYSLYDNCSVYTMDHADFFMEIAFGQKRVNMPLMNIIACAAHGISYNH